MRKPVAMTFSPKDHLIVACDDGTLWLQISPDKNDPKSDYSWTQIGPAIPGSAAAQDQSASD